MDISKIIVFNQFDVWKLCHDTFNIDNHHDLTMYYIYVDHTDDLSYLNNTRLLFNKQYNLITGQILKKTTRKGYKEYKDFI